MRSDNKSTTFCKLSNNLLHRCFFVNTAFRSHYIILTVKKFCQSYFLKESEGRRIGKFQFTSQNNSILKTNFSNGILMIPKDIKKFNHGKSTDCIFINKIPQLLKFADSVSIQRRDCF